LYSIYNTCTVLETFVVYSLSWYNTIMLFWNGFLSITSRFEILEQSLSYIKNLLLLPNKSLEKFLFLRSLWNRSLKGIVSWDFDSIFMILSYSFDVKLLPLDILFFQFWCFHIEILLYMIFSAWVVTLIWLQNLSKKILDKWRIFYFIFTLYPYWVFVKRDKLWSKKIKYKYENIKLKKKNPKRKVPNI
jgi:hypothetical protein